MNELIGSVKASPSEPLIDQSRLLAELLYVKRVIESQAMMCDAEETLKVF